MADVPDTDKFIFVERPIFNLYRQYLITQSGSDQGFLALTEGRALSFYGIPVYSTGVTSYLTATPFSVPNPGYAVFGIKNQALGLGVENGEEAVIDIFYDKKDRAFYIDVDASIAPMVLSPQAMVVNIV